MKLHQIRYTWIEKGQRKHGRTVATGSTRAAAIATFKHRNPHVIVTK